VNDTTRLAWTFPPDLSSEIDAAGELDLRAYLEGAKGDATFNRFHNTLRFAQADQRWLFLLKVVLDRLDSKSWMYQEGRRRVWVLETTYKDRVHIPLPSEAERLAFVRGYFDAEGGVPRHLGDRFYIQLVQKDKAGLEYVRTSLEELGIRCGRLHNPSVAKDPHYWRFYVKTCSHHRFCNRVASWHPRKRAILRVRFGDTRARPRP
jgi:hypothetical protein